MSIELLSFQKRALLFATLSSIAYNSMKEAKSQAKDLGFTTVKFYEKDGAQAYRFAAHNQLSSTTLKQI
jgi:triacylglycerol lipase